MFRFPNIQSLPPNCFVLIIYLFDNVSQIQLNPNVILQRSWHLWNIMKHISHKFKVILVIYMWPMLLCMWFMVESYFHYIKLCVQSFDWSNEGKQPHLINLVWFASSSYWVHTHIGTCINIKSTQECMFVWNKT